MEVIIGSLSVVLTILGIALTYNKRLRNKITREFSCSLIIDIIPKQNNKILRIIMRYSVNYKRPHPQLIKFVQLEFNKKLLGNLPPNPMVQEMFNQQKGVYYLPDPQVIDKSFDQDFVLDGNIIQEVNKYMPLRVRLNISTNDFGIVRSKWIKIK